MENIPCWGFFGGFFFLLFIWSQDPALHCLQRTAHWDQWLTSTLTRILARSLATIVSYVSSCYKCLGGSSPGLGSARSLPGIIWEQTFRANSWNVSFLERVKKSLPTHVSLQFVSLFPLNFLVLGITDIMSCQTLCKTLDDPPGCALLKCCCDQILPYCQQVLILVLHGVVQIQQWWVQLTRSCMVPWSNTLSYEWKWEWQQVGQSLGSSHCKCSYHMQLYTFQ